MPRHANGLPMLSSESGEDSEAFDMDEALSTWTQLADFDAFGELLAPGGELFGGLQPLPLEHGFLPLPPGSHLPLMPLGVQAPLPLGNGANGLNGHHLPLPPQPALKAAHPAPPPAPAAPAKQTKRPPPEDAEEDDRSSKKPAAPKPPRPPKPPAREPAAPRPPRQPRPPAPPGTARPPPAPLDITGAEGFDLLNAKEAELASALRLMPNAFLGIKQTILNECRRNNGIRRRQARELIKIDVNKTSRIWDLLKESGEVWVQGERPAGANANGTQAAAAAAPVAPAPAPAAAADAPPEAEP